MRKALALTLAAAMALSLAALHRQHHFGEQLRRGGQLQLCRHLGDRRRQRSRLHLFR